MYLQDQSLEMSKSSIYMTPPPISKQLQQSGSALLSFVVLCLCYIEDILKLFMGHPGIFCSAAEFMHVPGPVSLGLSSSPVKWK